MAGQGSAGAVCRCPSDDAKKNYYLITSQCCISCDSVPSSVITSLTHLRPRCSGPGNTVSLGWTNITQLPGIHGLARWVNSSDDAYNGNVSVQLTLDSFASPQKEGARVGVAARGLYHHGFALRAGRAYDGYVLQNMHPGAYAVTTTK